MNPEFIEGEGLRLTINDTLRVGYDTIKVGLCNNFLFFPENPDDNPQVTVDGFFGTSTLNTVTGNTSVDGNFYISAPRVFYQDDSFSMVSGSDSEVASSENSFFITPSSLTFNSIMTLQVSTQKVGVFTQNPQFELDVQGYALLSSVQTNTVNSKVLVLRLQSLL
jgi:hypothetical protein